MRIIPAAIIAAIALAGCSAPALTPGSSTTAPPAYTAPATDDTPTEDAPAWTPTKSDFVVKLKTLSKQCFGSAGCLVKVRATLTYAGDQENPGVGSTEIGFKIKGGEDPYESTFTLDSDGKYRPDEETISTPRSTSKLTAVVTSVEYDPEG